MWVEILRVLIQSDADESLPKDKWHKQEASDNMQRKKASNLILSRIELGDQGGSWDVGVAQG